MGDKTVTIGLNVKAAAAKKALGDLSKSINGLADDNKQLIDASKKATAVAAAGFAALSGSLIYAGVQAAQFDDKMRSVKTLLDDDAFNSVGKNLNDGFKDLKSGTLAVLNQIPIAGDDATKALFDLVSAGVDVTKANEALATSGKLAVAGLTDVGTATDGITSALNAYGLGAENADLIAAKFFAAQKKGKTTIAELSAGFGKVGATASSLGVSLDEVLSSVSALTLGGVKTAEAYTSLNAVMVGVAKPTAEAQKEAERLGIQFDLSAIKTKGLSGFLADLNKNQKFNKDSATKLFGSVEALKAIFALTGKGAEKYNEILGEIGDDTKALTTFTAAYETQQASLSNQTNIFTNKISSLAIQIGDRLEPAFAKIVKVGNDIVQFFLDLDDGTKDILVGITVAVTAILGAVAALGALALAVGAIVAAVPALIAGWTVLTATVLPAAVTAIGAVITAMAPIVAAVVAVGAAIYALKTAWETDFLGISTFLSGWFEVVKLLFTTYIDIWIAIFKGLSSAVMSVWQAVVDFFAPSIEEMGVAFNQAAENIGNDIDNLKEFFSDLWDTVVDGISDALAAIRDFIPGLKTIADVVGSVMGTITKAYQKGADERKAILAVESEDRSKNLVDEIGDEKAFLRARNAERNKAIAEQNTKERIAAEKNAAAVAEVRKQAAEKDKAAAEALAEELSVELLNIEKERLNEALNFKEASVDEIALAESQLLEVQEAIHAKKIDQINKEKIGELERIEKIKAAELELQQAKAGIGAAASAATGDANERDEKADKKASRETSALIAALAEGAADIAGTFGDALSGKLFDTIGSSISEIGGIPAQFAAAGEGLAQTLVTTADSAAQAVGNIPKIVDTLIGTFRTVFPKLVSSFIKAIPKIVKGLSKLAPVLVKGISKAIPQVLRSVLQALPELIGLLPELFTELLSGISEAFKVILQELPTIILALFDAIPQLFRSLIDIIPEFVETFAENIGPIIESLVEGILTAIPEIIIALVDSLLVRGGLERIVGALIRAMPRIAVGLVVGIFKALGNLIPGFGKIFSGMFSAGFAGAFGQITKFLGDAVKKAFQFPIEQFKRDLNLFKRIVDVLRNAFNKLNELPQRLFAKIKEALDKFNPFSGGGGGGGAVSKAIGVNVGFAKGTASVPPIRAANGLDVVTRAPNFRNTDSIDAQLTPGERVFSVPQNREMIEAMRNKGGGTQVIKLIISPSGFAKMVDKAIIESSTTGVGSVRVAVGSED
jgi:TP901 family phage tail tape measure protein